MIDQTYGAMYQTWSKSYRVSLSPDLQQLHHSLRLAHPSDEFFLGAGDINSSFLPPVKDGSTPQAEPLPTTSDSVTSASALEEASEEDSLARKAKMLDKLSEERPLQKMQEDMDKEAEQEVMDFTSGEGNGDGDAVAEIAGTKANGAQAEPSAGATTAGIADPGIGETGNATEAKEPETTTPPSSPPPRRRPLLKAEDGELHRIASVGLAAAPHSSLFQRPYNTARR